MPKQLRDAMRRFIKLYNERAEGWDDEGYTSITEELAGVSNEISKLISQMIKG